MRSHFRGVLVAFVMAASFFSARAEFVPPQDVPVDRVLKTAEAELAKDAGSARAHYTLARIHYLAFSRANGTVPAYMPAGNQEELGIPSRFMTGGWLTTARWAQAQKLAAEADSAGKATQAATERNFAGLQREGWRPAGAMEAPERVRHALAALKEFAAALQLKLEPLYLLGLASLQEEILVWKTTALAGTLPRELAEMQSALVQENYLKAFRAAYGKEAQLKYQGVEGLTGLVSYEAGSGYLRLSDRNRDIVRRDALVREEIGDALGKLRSIPRGPITPIIFALDPATSITPLLASELRVNFNLRGYGPAERWPWLQPTTALLVWDPAGRGEIVSGRQLFGGYTFQIFRKTGYDALAALDDDGSGELNGAELGGLCAWFDRNGDGRSELAEVVDLADLGIVGIDVRAAGKDGIHPTNPAGLRLRDGGRLPTWDWIVSPVAGPN